MLVVTLPNVHASVNYGFFILGGTVVGACSGKCENLRLTTSTADTSASVKDAKTVANFPVDPGVGSSTTTATEGASPSGFAWVYDIDLAGVQIQSGTWTFHVKTTATSATGTAFIHLQVFTCLTHSLGTCTKKITVDDAATNIQATTTATVRTYTATSVAAFNANFLAVEYWVDQTVASGSTTETITITTVASSTSDVQTPQWNEPLAQSVTDASAFGKVANHPYSLTQTITDSSALAKVANHFYSLTQTVTMASSLVKIAAHFYSLAQTVTSASSLSKVANHFYSLAQSFTSSGGLSRVVHYLDSFAQSITGASSLAKVANHIYGLSQSITQSHILSKFVQYVRGFSPNISVTSSNTNPANHSYSLTQSITGNDAVQKVAIYIENLAQAITGGSTVQPFVQYFDSLFGNVNINSILDQVHSQHILEDLSGTIEIDGRIDAIVPCDLATTCAGTDNAPAIALGIIAIGVAGAALYISMNKGKRRRGYKFF